MQRNPTALANEIFDVLVIGGGAFGAAAARDASLRGLKTALIEKSDFGGGASAECFKMVHGGIRYIQHLDIKRVRSSARERSVLLKIAPHLVTPLPIVIPTYGIGRKGKAFLGTGMSLYDLMTADRNREIPDASRRIPRTEFLSRSELLSQFPEVEAPSLTGATIFSDGQMYSPPRLVLAFVKAAVARGAKVANYVEAVRFLREGNKVTGVRARDTLDGQEFDIRARLVLNAAGPWAEYLLEGQSDFGQWKRGYFSRDACFVVNRKPRSKYAIAVQGQTRDRDAILSREARHMFVVPWRDYTLIGVWHKLFEQKPDTAIVEEGELTAWLAEMDASFPELALKRDEIVYTNRGLVPFGDGEGKPSELSFGKESRFLDHQKMHGISGLVTVIGIRYTTARGDASTALNMLLKQLPTAPVDRLSASEPLAGGDIEDFAAFERSAADIKGLTSAESLHALLRNHGTEYRQVAGHIAPGTATAPCVEGTDTLLAEVDHAVKSEMAVRLDDVVLRRTNLGSGSHPGDNAIENCARRMQDLSQWSDARRTEEIGLTTTSLVRHHAAVRARS